MFEDAPPLNTLSPKQEDLSNILSEDDYSSRRVNLYKR
jgi:hypothetical protein